MEDKIKIIKYNKVGIDEIGIIINFNGVHYSGCLTEIKFIGDK